MRVTTVILLAVCGTAGPAIPSCGERSLSAPQFGEACNQTCDCVDGLVCLSGTCTYAPTPFCTPDVKRCNGDFVETCNAAGTEYVANPTPCPLGCENGACKPRECDAEGDTCREDGRIQRCDGGRLTVAPEPCAIACVDGACALCDTGWARCDGADRQVCAEGRRSFVTIETCPNGCTDGSCDR